MNRTDLLIANLKAKRLVREVVMKHQSLFSPPSPQPPTQGQENVTQSNIQQQQTPNPIPPNQPV